VGGGDEGIAPLILSFGTRRGWSATRPAFLSLGKDCLVAGWAPERVWMLWGGGNLLILLGVEPRFLGRPAGSPASHDATALSPPPVPLPRFEG